MMLVEGRTLPSSRLLPSRPRSWRHLCQDCPLCTLPEDPVFDWGCAEQGQPPASGLTPALSLPGLHAMLVRLNSLSRVSGHGVQPGGFLGVGRAGCRPPLARALSQGPYCCSQQLREISAAVGCQFSAGTGPEGRVGSRGEECLSRAGEVICT